MRVWELPAFGLSQLRLREREGLRPGAHQLRVRIRAAALNYRDLLMIEGRYDPRMRLPLVPLSDGVGEILEVGEAVRGFAPGERVAGTFAQGWIAGEPSRALIRATLGGPLDGTLAEEVLLEASGAVHIPTQLSDVEAATLPCAGVTAWSALSTLGGVRAGDTVLVQGTGGVSVFALQLARLLGARVIATTSQAAKAAKLRDLGAAHVLNYREDPEWGKAARALTGGRGVDLVIDVGGVATLPHSLKAVRPGGTIALIGILSGARGELDLLPAIMNQVRLQGVVVGHRESFEAMNRAIEQHHLRPIVDRVFPFEEAPAAFERVRSGAHFGKICVEMG